MAKKSMVNRELKRAKLVERLQAKRNNLKAIIKSETVSFEEKQAAVIALQKMPRDSSASRKHSRCSITGRPHGVYSKFGLGRNKLREITMRGDIPGLRKASW
ncbi:30S ribosomal protein S14 [Wohlfahrtiimonas populi]|jgi:small subunit ribosomal protein S14|uniref:30S ribosomal protein S14 n=1 Tax=Wohlfahrtiimonas populi TaxID=1940240 RepID=UPI00098D054E|nr:30S ribosomal protein S14 [Wohlfahrtiimonas populi]